MARYKKKDWMEVVYAFISVVFSSAIISMTYFVLYPYQAPEPLRAILLADSYGGRRKHKASFKAAPRGNPFALYR